MSTQYAIGLDFGNYYSQPCIITGMNLETKKGGTVRDLSEPTPNHKYGIPNAFFYHKAKFGGKPICGEQAAKATPPSNCYRYLKRDMLDKNGAPNSVTIDGRTFSYDEMITAAAQYALRVAAAQLDKQFHITTNLVSLAYPASIGGNAKNHLVKLIEQATLLDGQHFKVVGTIAEPAAAALDYLAQDNTQKEQTILAYDFGAGTFDVSVVSVYPDGRKRADGSVYYYDIHCTDGYPNLGGSEIDKIMIQMLQEKAGADAKNPSVALAIRTSAEDVKLELSAPSAEYVYPEIILENGDYMGEIKRSDFEARIRPVIQKTVDLVEQTMKNPACPKIDRIVLTGGSSQIPLVKRMLQERFPAYRDKIGSHNPSKAIGAGAARYGTVESGPVPRFPKPDLIDNMDSRVKNTVVVRTIRDLGIRFFEDKNDKKGYVTIYVPSGTEIPFVSEVISYSKLGTSRKSRFSVFEATKSNPNLREPDRDFALVCNFDHDHEALRFKGYSNKSRIIIDEKHLFTLEVMDKGKAPKRYPFKVKILE